MIELEEKLEAVADPSVREAVRAAVCGKLAKERTRLVGRLGIRRNIGKERPQGGLGS